MQATQGTLSSLPSVCLSYAFPTRSQSVCPAPTSPSHSGHPPVFSFPSVALLRHLLSASSQLGFLPNLCHYIFLSHLSVHPYLLSVCPFPRFCLALFIPTCRQSLQASLQKALPFLSFSVSFSFAIPPMFKQIHPFQHLFFEFPSWFVSLTFTISFCLVHLTQTNVSQRIWPVTGSELYVYYLVELLLKFCEVGLSIPIYKCNN